MRATSGFALLVTKRKHDETYPCFCFPGDICPPAQKGTGMVSFFCAYTMSGGTYEFH